jgi:hypothetical protein
MSEHRTHLRRSCGYRGTRPHPAGTQSVRGPAPGILTQDRIPAGTAYPLGSNGPTGERQNTMFVIPSPVNTYATLLGRGLLGTRPL